MLLHNNNALLQNTTVRNYNSGQLSCSCKVTTVITIHEVIIFHDWEFASAGLEGGRAYFNFEISTIGEGGAYVRGWKGGGGGFIRRFTLPCFAP